MVFKVKVHEVKEKQLPQVDDEFAKDVSEFDTLADFKKDLGDKLKERRESQAQRDFEAALMEQVMSNMEVEIPDAMIENQVDMMVRNAEYRLGMQYGGMKLADYLKYMGTDLASFREGYRAQAESTVKSQLVIAVGCTGGMHRSVCMAEALYKHLKETGVDVSIEHRDLYKNDVEEDAPGYEGM